jgi:hypothetical protein
MRSYRRSNLHFRRAVDHRSTFDRVEGETSCANSPPRRMSPSLPPSFSRRRVSLSSAAANVALCVAGRAMRRTLDHGRPTTQRSDRPIRRHSRRERATWGCAGGGSRLQQIQWMAGGLTTSTGGHHRLCQHRTSMRRLSCTMAHNVIGRRSHSGARQRAADTVRSRTLRATTLSRT